MAWQKSEGVWLRHDVVYAQTPLNMNDPFDSMIGFSAEE